MTAKVPRHTFKRQINIERNPMMGGVNPRRQQDDEDCPLYSSCCKTAAIKNRPSVGCETCTRKEELSAAYGAAKKERRCSNLLNMPRKNTYEGM